jgi:hypothetical protein
VKLTVRKHVRAPPRRNAAYFPRTLRIVLLALGYSKPLLFVGVPRLLHGNSYLWQV